MRFQKTIKNNWQKKYNKKNKLEFIISSIAKKCGYLSLEDKYNCDYYKPLISNNLIN